MIENSSPFFLDESPFHNALFCIRERNILIFKNLVEQILTNMNVVLFGNPELLFRWSREDITGRTIRNKNSERTLFVVEAPVAIPLGADVFNTFSDIEKWHVRITRVLLLDRELSYTRKRVPAVGAGMRGQISEEINQAGPRILEEEALQRNIPVVEIPHKSIGESIERFLISIPQSSEKMTSNLVPNCSVVSSFFI